MRTKAIKFRDAARRPSVWVPVLFLAASVVFAGFNAMAGDPDFYGGSDGPPLVGGGYAGSLSCKECHEKQYERYEKYSRKSHSFEAVLKMSDGLTDEEKENCYKCHTTGYGEKTGFVSLEETPDLANVGCEACHGPGTLHTQTMDMAHIVKTVTIDVCEKCHNNPDYPVESFRYGKVIYAGAH